MRNLGLLPLRAQFLNRLAALRELADAFLLGREGSTALSGSPAEFQGYRPYLPGDDIRWIDWNLFARSGELFIKVFRVDEEVEAAILLDASRSMHRGDGAKYQVAAAAAGALAFLGLLTSHPVTLVRYAERALEVSGPHRQAEAFARITRALLLAPAGRGTDLARGLAPVISRRRPVTLLAITDGFQHARLERAAALAAATGRMRLVVCLVGDRRDRRPPLRGNLLVGDDEGGGAMALLADRGLERELHRAVDVHFRDLEQGLARLGAQLVRLDVAEPFEEQFLGLLRGRERR